MKHLAHLKRTIDAFKPIAGCIALLLFGSQGAWAQTSAPAPLGPFAIKVGYAAQNDSNIFRSSSDTKSEQTGVTTLGLGFASNQGLQKLQANVSAVNSKYQTYDYLNYTATNYDAAWRWALSPQWTGNLITSRAEAQNSFANVQNISQRNLRTTTATGLDTTYTLQGAWSVVAGIATYKQANDQAVLGADDYSSSTADLGVQYNFSSGSTLTYRANFTSGSYIKRSVPNALLADDGFKEMANDLRLHWAFAGASSADVYATALRRTHPFYATRDYDGVNTGATLNWTLSGKTGVVLSATHTLAAYETVNTNYSSTDTVSLAPVWQVSPKIALRLLTQWSQIGYQGSPTAVATLERKDQQQDTTLSMVWTPTQQWNLGASIQKSSRSSNLAGQDYDANIVGLSATFTF